jgi:hypothetical protein
MKTHGGLLETSRQRVHSSAIPCGPPQLNAAKCSIQKKFKVQKIHIKNIRNFKSSLLETVHIFKKVEKNKIETAEKGKKKRRKNEKQKKKKLGWPNTWGVRRVLCTDQVGI